MIPLATRRTVILGFFATPAYRPLLPVLTATLGAATSHAADPVTVIAAASAAVNAISTLLSANNGALDPASKEYLDRIINNQQIIAKQISLVNSNLAILAEALSLIPAQTVALDKEVQAIGVYHGITESFISLLMAGQKGQVTIGPSDRSSFNELRNDLNRSAREHIVLVQKTAQSVDVIVALNTLLIALDSCVDYARLAKFSHEDDKRTLEDIRRLILRSASDVSRGGSTPALGTFKSAQAEAHTALDRLSEELERSGDKYIRASLTREFFRDAHPRYAEIEVFLGKFSFDPYYETCGGHYQIPFGPSDLGATVKPAQFGGDCRPREMVPDDYPVYERAEIVKTVLPTSDGSDAFFSISVTPAPQKAKLLDSIGRYNNAMRRAQILHSAGVLLTDVIKRCVDLEGKISGL